LNIHSYHGKGDHFEHFQTWVNFLTSQGSFLWSVIIIKLKIYFEHSWLQLEWWEVPIQSDQNIYFSGKKESPLDSIVTNLGPSKYTHRSPSKIWYIDLSSYQTPRSLDLWVMRTTADNSCVTERINNNNNNNNFHLLLNISRIIPMKFHYNRIKNNSFIFHGYHVNGRHFENFKP
jgi:hypothetical protein